MVKKLICFHQGHEIESLQVLSPSYILGNFPNENLERDFNNIRVGNNKNLVLVDINTLKEYQLIDILEEEFEICGKTFNNIIFNSSQLIEDELFILTFGALIYGSEVKGQNWEYN